MLPQITYSPSGRKVTVLIVFLLLFSGICFKQSNTYDVTAHRLALCGSGLFVLLAVAFMIQFLRGLPSITLTESGFILNSGMSGDLRPWDSYYNFTVGQAFGPFESIKFIRKDTGADGAILNVSNVPTHVICEKLNACRERYSQSTGDNEAST